MGGLLEITFTPSPTRTRNRDGADEATFTHNPLTLLLIAIRLLRGLHAHSREEEGQILHVVSSGREDHSTLIILRETTPLSGTTDSKSRHWKRPSGALRFDGDIEGLELREAGR